MTVREMVAEIQKELLAGDIEPARSRELLVKLTALLGNCMAEIRVADAAYSTVLLRFLDSEAKANRAVIRAETSQEYARKREAHDTRVLVVEMIRALKTNVRSLSDEIQLTR